MPSLVRFPVKKVQSNCVLQVTARVRVFVMVRSAEYLAAGCSCSVCRCMSNENSTQTLAAALQSCRWFNT